MEVNQGYERFTIRDLPAAERPREKIYSQGVKSLSNAELLGILIGQGSKECSAVELGNQILTMEPTGIQCFAEYLPQEFERISGIGIAKASQLVAAIEFGKRIALSKREESVSIESPEIVANLFMERMRYFKQEVFQVVLLDVKNKIISVEEISIGGLHQSLAHPREVFSVAIKKAAKGIILIHNHPSGDPEPSSNDIGTTKRLIVAGELLGIEVVDHIIIGDGIFTSLREKNLM